MGAKPSKASPAVRLHAAVSKGDEAAVLKLLASKGAANVLSVADAEGLTALHVAARDGQENLVIVLLTAGADATALVSPTKLPSKP